jgi:hypothetical protein
MKRYLYKIWSKFLTAFGEIKIFKYPMFIVYDPAYFKITGEEVMKILDIIEPGDIILRGYDYYLDGKFVPDELSFSHGGIYVGNNKIIHAVAEGVSETNIIEFTRCDRIAIFRPIKYQKQAIKKAKQYLKNNIPYDFGFQEDVSSVYCFELCGLCYPKLNIPRLNVSKLFGLIKKKNVFLAKSFFTSNDMKCIYHFNPKFNISL